MARTKQTARKSTSGMAPRMQMATTTSRGVRQYFQSQQSTGTGAGAKKPTKIFVNCENTFREFKFKRAETALSFTPAIVAGRVSVPSISGGPAREELLIRMEFPSVFDGRAAAIQSSRPPLDARRDAIKHRKAF